MDSTALREANERLLALRAAMKKKPSTVGCQPPTISHQPPANFQLPNHLGWDSPAVTAVLRKREPVSSSEFRVSSSEESVSSFEFRVSSLEEEERGETLPVEVRVYPDIALGMLRCKLAAPGRVWLLLKALDGAGRGCVALSRVRELLAVAAAPWGICGGRQLRNVLHQGEGVFWHCEDGWLWLRAAGKVAAALDVEKLRGYPVAVPTRELMGSLSRAKAHLFASFHSGRRRETLAGARIRPISRTSLERLSGVGRRSQQAYEAEAHTAVTTNIAVSGAATEAEKERRAWEQGTAVFELKDNKGKQGPVGQVYVAWQLPNSYDGRHRQLPRGQQRKINKELADLLKQRTTGNDQPAMRKCYCANGRQAVTAFEKNQKTAYWQRKGGGNTAVWQVVG